MAKGVPLTDDDKLRICEMLEKNLRPSEIAKKTGLSHQSIYRVRNEMYGKDIRSMDTAQWEAWKQQILKPEPGKPITETKPKKPSVVYHPYPRQTPTVGNKPEPEPELIRQTADSIRVAAIPPEEPKTEAKNPAKVDSANAPIYVFVANGKLAGYFTNYDDAKKAQTLANHVLSFAGYEQAYEIVKVNPYPIHPA